MWDSPTCSRECGEDRADLELGLLYHFAPITVTTATTLVGLSYFPR
jgi:hypothetical protein